MSRAIYLANELRLFNHREAADLLEALWNERAAVWDEGCAHGQLYERVYWNDNPYREEAE